jgi:crotonobetainyl-CoA:carnitine CoA-transferase CaiB-like acyl-CoA transferase
MSGPLSHIRVLDLSRVLAGPFAGQIFGDLGAEVIKVERPDIGDDTRYWGPPFVKNADGTDGDAAYYLAANRNKTTCSIDMTTQEGQAEIKALAKTCDIVIENFRVGGLKKYGLDYEGLKAVNPAIIYCSITGFGQTGPYAKRAGYDFLIQGMSGMMSITGEKEGTANSSPQKVGVAIADLGTGMYAVIGILAALAHRDQTGGKEHGEGQYIDLSLLDSMISLQANQNMNYLVGGTAPVRAGNAHPNIVPYQTFATKDGHIILAVGNDRQFDRFSKLLGENWSEMEAYKSNITRVKNRQVLIPLIAPHMLLKTTAQWMIDLEEQTIPCGPVNTIEQAFGDEQVQHRGMLRMMTREDGSEIPTVSNPINFSKTPIQYKKAPPKRTKS